jgi:hypothetical protein
MCVCVYNFWTSKAITKNTVVFCDETPCSLVCMTTLQRNLFPELQGQLMKA